MQRRRFLTLGLGAGTVLALAGAGAALWTPGWRDGRLSEPARALFRVVAQTVLAGCLPTDPAIQPQALDAHLGRLEASIRGFAPATRAELSDLLALLGTTPGRLALTGVRSPWAQASVEEVAAALQAMRLADSATRQQVYHALRDLTNAAWFADAGTWGLLGYPGPTTI